jgi:hypothetical protein
MEKDRPTIDGSVSGFVLMYSFSLQYGQLPANITASLAKRTGEPEFCTPSRIGSAEWLERYKKEIPVRSRNQRTSAFATLAEKDSAEKGSVESPQGSGRRSIRTLPFSESVFRLITKKFYTHGSISRVISRADVQTFSCSNVVMGESEAAACVTEGKQAPL